MNEKIRVLIVGTVLIGDDDATGVSMENMLLGSQHIDWYQFCVEYNTKTHVEIVPTMYLNPKVNFGYYVIKKIYNTCFRGAGGYASSAYTHSKKISLSSIGRYFLDIIPKHLTKKELNILREYSPDAIYTMAGSISIIKMCLFLSSKLNIPIVAHFMDDLESNIYSNLITANKKYNKYLQKLFQRSTRGLAISKKMAEEYTKRHGLQFGYAMNCVEKPQSSKQKTGSKLILLFSGGLHGGRNESIRALGEVISADAELKNIIRLCVYTSKHDYFQYKESIGDICEFREYVPKDQMFANLRKADILVHVESFDINEIEYFRLSLSTKIPEYLSVGKPILCYGPRELNTVQYVEECGAGVVASTREELHYVLNKIVLDSGFREKIEKNCQNTFNKEHLKKIVTKRIEDVFFDTIKDWEFDE